MSFESARTSWDSRLPRIGGCAKRYGLNWSNCSAIECSRNEATGTPPKSGKPTTSIARAINQAGTASGGGSVWSYGIEGFFHESGGLVGRAGTNNTYVFYHATAARAQRVIEGKPWLSIMMQASVTPVVPASSVRGRQIKVLLVTVGLGVGGTEGQVLELASRLDPARFDVVVCALKGEGVLAAEMQARGVRVVLLHGKGQRDVRVLYRLVRLVQAQAPDLIHSFLSLANLASRLAGRVCRVPVVISSYRDREIWKSGLDRLADRSTFGWIQAATCCSDSVRQFVVGHIGGESGKLMTIH